MDIPKFLHKKEIMYVIIGTQSIFIHPNPEVQKLIEKNRAYIPPSYDTDPRKYSLPVFIEKITDEEFESKYRETVRAFYTKEDAFKFAFTCNMVSLQCPVYIKINGKWRLSKKETEKMAEEIS